MEMNLKKGPRALQNWALLGLGAFLLIVIGCQSNPKSSSTANGSPSSSGGASGLTGSAGNSGSNSTTGGSQGGSQSGSTGNITVPPNNGNTNQPGPKNTPGVPIIPYKKGALAPLQIPAKGTNGWVNTTKTAGELAALADKSMMILNDAGFDAFVTLNVEKGRGMSRVHGDIANKSKYRIQYESWAGDHPGVILVVSNGTTMYTDHDSVLETGNKSPVRVPIRASSPGSGLKLLNGWLTDMPAYVTGWYRFMAPVYAPLVDQLMDPANQFKVTVEKRVTPYEGQLVTNYRILATREPDSTMGYAELEIVLDGERFLPVTVRSRYRFPGAGPNEMMWSGHWFPQTVPSKKFQLPVLPQKKP